MTEATQQANRAQMDPRRLVVIAYLIFGAVIAMFLGHLLELIFANLNLSNPRVIEGLDFRLCDIVGVVAAAGGAIYCWTNSRINSLSMEVASELMRVTWPTFEETRVSTIAVVVASLVAATILFGMDSLSYRAMVKWLPMLWER